jgi:rhodanese-related sulfurtransferase
VVGLDPVRRAGDRFHDHGDAIGLFAVVSPAAVRTIDQVVADARARLDRLSPRRASQAVADGAVLVDIRPAAQRAAEGTVPGALIVERNVLEWRFDPACPARLPEASYDLQVIIFCSEGWTSSLAAASLQDLGVRRATDLNGGFHAWRRAGLPVCAGDHSSDS